MNIFYFDNTQKICATYHSNRHVISQIKESCQLLSTAHHVLDGKEVVELSATGRKQKRFKLVGELENTLYKSTHANHPSAIWARSSRENYLWLAHMTKALCEEYTYRYGKIHKCQADGLVDVLINNTPKNIPDKPFTEPTPAMDSQYIIKGDSITSYRNYFNKAKRHLFDWKNRDVPYWVEI